MKHLRVGLIQTDIIWEDISGNLNRIYPLIASVKGLCDIVILPEMCTTGFSMNAAILAENVPGLTTMSFQRMAQENDLAICGSFICKEHGKIFNRGFFITPNELFFYDKHHLFRMGDEAKHFAAGMDQQVITFKGWDISLMICYDLRFPAWCRNINNRYDLQIFTANWPEVRQNAWEILLQARAIENQAYVVGVNRVGKDGNNLRYRGGSTVIDMKGNQIGRNTDQEECILIKTLDKVKLEHFRQKFPSWMDADKFLFLQ